MTTHQTQKGLKKVRSTNKNQENSCGLSPRSTTLHGENQYGLIFNGRQKRKKFSLEGHSVGAKYSAFFLISTKATKDNIKTTRGLITDETTGQYYEKYIKYSVLRSNL